MKLDCNAYHMAFFLFLVQGGFDVQEKVFGLLKVKLDSLDASFADVFPTYDFLYFLCFSLSTLLFWRVPWIFGFRKVAIVSITLRAALYFCCMITPGETPSSYNVAMWSLQGLLQGLIQAPITGLILQQYRNNDDSATGRWADYRYALFTFFVGIISSCMAFVSAPNVADETLCSTLITVGLLVVNVLNYVVCFYPFEQVELGFGGLRSDKEAPASGTALRRIASGIGSRLREIKQFLFDRQLFSIVIALTTCQIVRYYMFFKLPLEYYYRVLFPAPPFQLMFLSSACLFDFIGLVGAVLLLSFRNRIPYFRNLSIDRPFAIAFLAVVIGAPLFTPAIEDVDRVEDSMQNMRYLALYVFGIAFTQFARLILLGPALLRLGESLGNAPGVLAFVHGFSSLCVALTIILSVMCPIEGLVERCVPYAVVGGVTALGFFFADVCCSRRSTVLVSNIGYRPLLTESNP